MAEWSKALAWKVSMRQNRIEGSNPSRSATHLDSAFIEIVEQACIDAHLAEIFSRTLPMGAAAADGAVMNADHSVAQT